MRDGAGMSGFVRLGIACFGLLAPLSIAPANVQAAPRTYATEAVFVQAMTGRMTPLHEGAIYTPAVAARRCLNFISGAHGTPTLRQGAGRTNRDFTLSLTQSAAFRGCVREEGYTLR